MAVGMVYTASPLYQYTDSAMLGFYSSQRASSRPAASSRAGLRHFCRVRMLTSPYRLLPSSSSVAAGASPY